MTTRAEFQALLEAPEGSRVEFKRVSGGFHFEELVKYCVALANERGGTIVLGVTDKRPRQVIGTRAFAEPGRAEAGLFERLRQRIPIEEHDHDGKRVLLVHEFCDPEFLRFLEEIGRERMAAFGTDDFLVVDLVHREQPIPEVLRPRVDMLLEQGILERVGRGRGSRLLLSRRFYRHLGRAGTYTRKIGLDRETNRQLLLKHILDIAGEGTTLADLQEVLPALGRRSIQGLLKDLRSEGKIRLEGKTRAAKWYAT